MDTQVQQMMALANLQRQPQQGQMQGMPQQQQVDVGACGMGAYPMQNPAFVDSALLGGCNQPNLSNNVVDGCQVYRQCVFPVGVFFCVDAEVLFYHFGTTDISQAQGQSSLRIFPDRGRLHIFGFKSQIGCNRVLITSITSGDSDFEHIQGEGVDACAYNTDNCYCYANWGCFSTSNSFQLQARAISGTTGCEPFVGTLWCVREQALNACGPIPSCLVG